MQVFSADHFFMKDGVYVFEPAKLGQAHQACLRNYTETLQGRAKDHWYLKDRPKPRVTILRGIPGAGKSTWIEQNKDQLDLVVDNTSPNVIDVATYAGLAQAYGADFEIVTIRVDPKIAAARNVHGVPADFIEKCAKYLDEGTNGLMPWWPHRLIDTYTVE